MKNPKKFLKLLEENPVGADLALPFALPQFLWYLPFQSANPQQTNTMPMKPANTSDHHNKHHKPPPFHCALTALPIAKSPTSKTKHQIQYSQSKLKENKFSNTTQIKPNQNIVSNPSDPYWTYRGPTKTQKSH